MRSVPAATALEVRSAVLSSSIASPVEKSAAVPACQTVDSWAVPGAPENGPVSRVRVGLTLAIPSAGAERTGLPGGGTTAASVVNDHVSDHSENTSFESLYRTLQ